MKILKRRIKSDDFILLSHFSLLRIIVIKLINGTDIPLGNNLKENKISNLDHKKHYSVTPLYNMLLYNS